MILVSIWFCVHYISRFQFWFWFQFGAHYISKFQYQFQYWFRFPFFSLHLQILFSISRFRLQFQFPSFDFNMGWSALNYFVDLWCSSDLIWQLSYSLLEWEYRIFKSSRRSHEVQELLKMKVRKHLHFLVVLMSGPNTIVLNIHDTVTSHRINVTGSYTLQFFKLLKFCKKILTWILCCPRFTAMFQVTQVLQYDPDMSHIKFYHVSIFPFLFVSMM